MFATIITFARYDAWTLGVVIEAGLRHRELAIDWKAVGRVSEAIREWHGHGFAMVPLKLTAAERDAARVCWEALALGYPQISERQYNHVVRVLLVG
jgi:hypothetical protein